MSTQNELNEKLPQPVIDDIKSQCIGVGIIDRHGNDLGIFAAKLMLDGARIAFSYSNPIAGNNNLRITQRTDCDDFEAKSAPWECGDCQTDGHYLCGGCKHIAKFEDMELSDNMATYYPKDYKIKCLTEDVERRTELLKKHVMFSKGLQDLKDGYSADANILEEQWMIFRKEHNL